MPLLEILAVGRLKEKAEKNLEARYQDRILKTGKSAGIRSLSILEITESNLETSQKRRAREAEDLLKKITPQTLLIALDENGKTLSSKVFASELQTFLSEGHTTISYALGGPDGHGKDLLNASNQVISLSPLTFPHGLARILLLEQIYRAITIWARHPYHRE